MEENINQTEASTKEQILSVTISMINAGEIEKITTRRVATLAGVNIGAVNYHFGTKEQLLDEAFENIMSPIKEIYSILDSDDGAPRERLKKFLTEMARHISTSPAPLKYYVVMSNTVTKSRTNLIKMFKTSMFGKLIKTIAEITGETDMNKVSLRAIQLISSVALPNIILSVGNHIFEGDVPTPEEQVEILMERIK